MKKSIQRNHDTLLELKPTMKRLGKIFEPEGKFDKMYDRVVEHESKIKSNSSRIQWIFGIVGSIIVSLIVFFVTNH